MNVRGCLTFPRATGRDCIACAIYHPTVTNVARSSKLQFTYTTTASTAGVRSSRFLQQQHHHRAGCCIRSLLLLVSSHIITPLLSSRLLPVVFMRVVFILVQAAGEVWLFSFVELLGRINPKNWAWWSGERCPLRWTTGPAVLQAACKTRRGKAVFTLYCVRSLIYASGDERGDFYEVTRLVRATDWACCGPIRLGPIFLSSAITFFSDSSHCKLWTGQQTCSRLAVALVDDSYDRCDLPAGAGSTPTAARVASFD